MAPQNSVRGDKTNLLTLTTKPLAATTNLKAKRPHNYYVLRNN